MSFLSCYNSKKDKNTYENLEKRFLYVSYNDSLRKSIEYELTKEENDSIIKYDYRNLIDSEKNMVFKFVKKSESLITFGTEFKLIKKGLFIDNELSNLAFNLYALSVPVDDGNSPFFFNSQYGILNLDNSWGKSFLYLKKEKEPEFAKKLIKALRNKTH